MKAAGNALGLLYCATWLQKPEVLLEARKARKAHVAATKLLRQEVEKPSVNLMAVLGAAEALISCEAYSLVSSGPQATTTHLSGIMDVIRSTKHEAATANIRSFLFRKFRHLSLMQSLVSRRALAGEHIWWLCSAVQKPSNVENLFQLAVQLPPLLEITEIVRGSRDTDEYVARKLQLGLVQLEVKLKEWLSDYESTVMRAFRLEEDVEESKFDDSVYWLDKRPVITVPALRLTCSCATSGVWRSTQF